MSTPRERMQERRRPTPPPVMRIDNSLDDTDEGAPVNLFKTPTERQEDRATFARTGTRTTHTGAVASKNLARMEGMASEPLLDDRASRRDALTRQNADLHTRFGNNRVGTRTTDTGAAANDRMTQMESLASMPGATGNEITEDDPHRALSTDSMAGVSGEVMPSRRRRQAKRPDWYNRITTKATGATAGQPRAARSAIDDIGDEYEQRGWDRYEAEGDHGRKSPGEQQQVLERLRRERPQ